MKYILSALLLIAFAGCFSQSKQYLYYFDKDLNVADEAHAVFYGTGAYENGLLKLMLYNNKDRHLIMIEHFADSTLQLSEGLFSSYYSNRNKESEGNYTKGKQDGWWERWDSSGSIIDSSLYTNGDIAARTSYYYFSDKKIQSIMWDDVADHRFRLTNYDQNGKIVKIDTITNNNEDEDKVFTKSEIEAQFPGGPAAWSKYITGIIQQHVDEFTRNDYGTCQVVFIVRKDGKVTDVQVRTMKGTKLADIAIAAIANGPDWIPALQNGHKVNAYRIQPVTLLEPK